MPTRVPPGEAIIRLSPTPAPGAGLPAGEIDLRDRRLTQWGAAGIVLATYLLITASPILGSFRTGIDGLVLQPVDYGSFAAWRDLAMRLGQIGGTVLILVLICRWLGSRVALSTPPATRQPGGSQGHPRRRSQRRNMRGISFVGLSGARR